MPAGAGTAAGSRQGTAPAAASLAYAPSTLQRYGQIAKRYAAWAERRKRDGGPSPDCAGFLGETAGDVAASRGSAHGRQDPRHLALRRTTICALRAASRGGGIPDPTIGMRLPPRPPPVAAAAPATVAALRRGVRSEREGLLLVLSCGLGLGPGQMNGLRWGDVRLDAGLVDVERRHGTRQVMIPADCQAALTEYAKDHGPQDLLFPSPTRGPRQPATVRTLQNALQRLALRVGAARDTTFTSLNKVTAERPAPAPAPACQPDVPARRPAVHGAPPTYRPAQPAVHRLLRPGTRYQHRDDRWGPAAWT